MEMRFMWKKGIRGHLQIFVILVSRGTIYCAVRSVVQFFLSFHSIPHIVLSLLLIPPNVHKFIAIVGCTKNLRHYVVRPMHHKTCSLELISSTYQPWYSVFLSQQNSISHAGEDCGL